MHFAGRTGLVTMLLSLSGMAAADVLVSANGDRLAGTLVERRGDVLVFDSELLGRVEVPAALARIEADPPAAAPAVAVAAPPAPVAAAPAPDATPDAKPDATPGAEPTGWSSDVGVRLSVDRGSLESAEDDLLLSVKSRRPTRHGVITTGIGYRYKNTDDELKDDDWDIEVGYERFISKDVFVAARALATRELTGEGYDETKAALVSAGWRWWEGEGQHLRVGPALGYLMVRRGVEELEAPALGLYATAQGPAWARLRFSSELVFLDTAGDGRYANLELRLRQPLGKRLYLALVWDYAWSDFNIEPGVRSEWRWDLGWRFGPEAGR